MTEYELPPGRPLSALYQHRVRENQDLATVVSDRANRRGTGKTVLSLRLARAMDRTDEGITENKVALDPGELAEAYVEEPRGSALVLDEAEAGLSKYEAASSVNKAIRELVGMGRVLEKYVIFNLPASSELDRDLKALCDYWLMVTRKGRAQGHILDWQPYREEPRTPKVDPWVWDDLTEDSDLRDVYDYLTEEKMAHLHGERDQSSQRLKASEVNEMLEQAKSETRTETRDQVLANIYDTTELTQRELADAVDLSRSRVGTILSQTEPATG